MPLTPEQNQAHRIRWYVRAAAGEPLIPRESTMRGHWDSEAKCSCGWETHEGGALPSWIKKRIKDHKFDVEHGFWTPEDQA